MAPKCNLIIDSCCDLPMSMVDKPGITLINYPYLFGDESYFDDLFTSITPQQFYGRMRAGEFPSTAQIPVPVMQKALTDAAESGIPTVYLSFSSGLTGTVDQAWRLLEETKQQYPDAELYLFDTLLASTAEAVLVAGAIEQRSKGATAQEILEWSKAASAHTNCEFMVDDLEALKHGGRIPAAAASVGAMLDVKPLLTINPEGSLSLCGMARGRKKGIKQLVSFFTRTLPEGDRARTVYIGNADCAEDARRLEHELKKVNSDIETVVTNVGPVIGSHTGPGMLSIAFFGPHRSDNDPSSGIFGKKKA